MNMNKLENPCQATIDELAELLGHIGFNIEGKADGVLHVSEEGIYRSIGARPKEGLPEGEIVCEVRAGVGKVFYTNEEKWIQSLIEALRQDMADPRAKSAM